MGEERKDIMADSYNESAENAQEAISCKILDHIGVLRVSAAGWTRELNYISWNDRPAKYDIREWTPDHKKAGRGITLTEYEMGRICEWMTARNSTNSVVQGGEESVAL